LSWNSTFGPKVADARRRISSESREARSGAPSYEVPDDLIDRKTAKAIGRKSFDAIEGEGINYKREMIEVRRPCGQIVSALTYTAKSPKSDLKTNEKYVGYIVTGLRKRGVNQQYIERVKAVALANNPEISTELNRL